MIDPHPAVEVTNGPFSLQLDFGADALAGAARFETRVTRAGFRNTLPAALTARARSSGRSRQAICEVLPNGDKEKQLLQGLLRQRDKID